MKVFIVNGSSEIHYVEKALLEKIYEMMDSGKTDNDIITYITGNCGCVSYLGRPVWIMPQ
jgi:cytochrome c-type biogenesis protein CcmH/NrfF